MNQARKRHDQQAGALSKQQLKQQPKQRHLPLRRCVVCRQQRPQAELLRFYRDATGKWQLDPSGKAGGRGAWLCRVPNAGLSNTGLSNAGSSNTAAPACTNASVKTLARFFKNQAERVHTSLQVYVSQEA